MTRPTNKPYRIKQMRWGSWWLSWWVIRQYDLADCPLDALNDQPPTRASHLPRLSGPFNTLGEAMRFVERHAPDKGLVGTPKTLLGL